MNRMVAVVVLFVAAAFVAVFVSLSSSPQRSLWWYILVSFDRYLMVSVVLYLSSAPGEERPKVIVLLLICGTMDS